ncbi:prealbumin-like fold domain-containing protein [Microbacterium algeriense]|uniref:prealbumin-like fold domain-containing protein n=1 Tax=Microbacterium algeriense TaxID=2615184 RepID=UPI003D761D3C
MRKTTDRRRGRIASLLTGTILLGSVLAPGGAAAVVLPPTAADVPLLVTYVARVCDEYTDVMANKARNNLMESLRDLGPDSTYPGNGVVTVADEAAGSPNCRPLSDWRLTLGQSYQGKSPATLDLSTVTQPFGTAIVTRPEVPELDANGADTGRTIDGAVTVPLDSAQAAIVRSGRTLWVQGGTPTAPLNGQQTTYGYAALRCAQDAVNGDNVEFVSFPKNQTHVFCYYYAVSPPPESGTIVIRKQLAPGSLGQGTFRFDGNLSFADTNADGVNDFLLAPTATAPASQTFVRGAVGAGDPAWQVSEASVGDGWQPAGPPACTSALGTPVSISGQTAQIGLLAGDTVTCTFTNDRVLTGPGSLSKLTLGGGGTFPFTIDVPDPGVDRTATVTTEGDGDQALVADAVGSIPGTYTVTETLPAPTGAGSWDLVDAQCNGSTVPVTTDGRQRTGSIRIGEGEGFDCLVTNEFTPGGSITIRKATSPTPGTAGFVVTQRDGERIAADAGEAYRATVTTTDADRFEEVEWDGAAPRELVVDPASRYGIVELLPAPSAAGSWALESVDCGPNDADVDLAAASVDVTLTTQNPDAVCDFTNVFRPAGHLRVIKNATTDVGLRDGDAELEVQCTPDTDYAFTVPRGSAAFDTGEAPVLDDQRCRVVETATGAAAGASVVTSATVRTDDGPAVPLEPFDSWFPVAAGTDTTVTIDNSYTADTPDPAPSPNPSPSTPAPAPTADPGAGDLAATGLSGPTALLAAAGLLAAAAGLLVARSLRRRGESG